jgi:ketosteroid isomerase-like protein
VSNADNVALIRALHSGERPILDLLVDVAVDDIEWWAAGPSDVLPWAGTFRGLGALRRWTEILREHAQYERFEPTQYICDDDEVVVVIRADGHMRSTGRSFASELVRIFTVRDGKVVRVRTWYDTAAYARALYPLGVPEPTPRSV